MTLPDPSDTKQPKPLRLIAAVSALITLVIGGLPAFGIALDSVQIGIITGVVGAFGAIAVVIVGEPQVTPVVSPRSSEGVPLVPATVVPPEPPAGRHVLPGEDGGTVLS